MADARYTPEGLPIVTSNTANTFHAESIRIINYNKLPKLMSLDIELDGIRVENSRFYFEVIGFINAGERAIVRLPSITPSEAAKITRRVSEIVLTMAYGLLRKQSAAYNLEDQIRE